MTLDLLDKNVKIKLKPEVSKINVDNESLYLKYQNKLFRIDAGARDNRLKVLHILKRPKKITEILDLLSKFRKIDVIDFLRRLDSLELLDIDADDSKNLTLRADTKLSKPIIYYHGRRNNVKSSSRVLLIGNGILARKLYDYLSAMNIKCNRMTSSVAIRKYRENKNTKDRSKSYSGERSPTEYSLIVAVEDFPNLVLFETINKLSFKKNVPWLRVSFDDNIGYLGPFVIPGKTSCFNCCQLRLATNSWQYEYQLWKHREFIPETKLTAAGFFIDVLMAVCSNEINMFLTNRIPNSMETLYLFDTQKMEISKHNVILHPSCFLCRTVQAPKVQSLLSSGNISGKSNSHKRIVSNSVLSDHELLQRLEEIVDEKTGIVTKTQKYFESISHGIKSHHFYGAFGGLPIRDSMYMQLGNEKEGNLFLPAPSGTGISPYEAKLHALMEFVERYSNMLVDKSRVSWKTFNEVRHRAINPLDLGLYQDKDYRTKGFRCSKFSPDANIPWVEGEDLFNGNKVLLCADFVYYPAIREKPLVIETSNGAASHTNLVQAILHGLYEVIERDAFLIMWLNKLSMPIIDVRNLSFGFNESIKRINKLGMSVKFIDLTNDTDVPTVMAVCYNKYGKYPALLVGAGTHVDPTRATQKALLEIELLLLHNIENPTDKKNKVINKIRQPHEHGIYYLNPDKRMVWNFMIKGKKKSTIFSRAKSRQNNYSALMGIVKRLHKLGHRVIWVNITPPDVHNLGIRVVKVFVTGFQPLYFGIESRLNLERLYKSPIVLGYSKKNEFKPLNTALHPLS